MLYLIFWILVLPTKSSKILSHKNCQRNLLITEINLKNLRPRVLKSEFYLLHSELKSVLNCIDFTHVCCLFLRSNVISKSHDSILEKKFNVLFKNRQPKLNPDGVIFSYSRISLSDEEKSQLVKGLRFSLPPKKLII